MTSRDFCYWLQGYLEIASAEKSPGLPPSLSPLQVECIQKHLSMVFIHEIDPSFGGPEKQSKLEEAHKPPGSIGGDVPGYPGVLARC